MKLNLNFKEFLDDNMEEAVLCIFAYGASLSSVVADFLAENEWSANLFFVGLLGQLCLRLFLYVSGRSPKYKTRLEHIGKTMAALVLGGCTAMIFGGKWFPENIIGIIALGAFFQAIWDKVLPAFLSRLLPDITNKKPTNKDADDDGGDVGTGGGGN